MGLFKKPSWEKGRQGTGYLKMQLFKVDFFDVHLIKYRKGDSIPFHKDEIHNRSHHRVNITLKQSKIGGEFKCDRPVFKLGPIVYFRPDKYLHKVTRVRFGERLVLSIGVSLKNQ